MASKETIQAISKYFTCDRSIELVALKERFKEDLDWCVDQSVAAALAYMIAKDELEAAKEEEEEPDVYDDVVDLIRERDFGNEELSPHATVDQIFTLIYEWLDESLAEMGYEYDFKSRTDIKELFQPFIIETPEA